MDWLLAREDIHIPPDDPRVRFERGELVPADLLAGRDLLHLAVDPGSDEAAEIVRGLGQ